MYDGLEGGPAIRRYRDLDPYIYVADVISSSGSRGSARARAL
jgi:hypothetical protein